MDTEGEAPFPEGGADSAFKVNKDSVIISLAQSHRSARSSNIVYQEPLETDRGEYYEEWLQKCVAWIAYSLGIKRMDCYSLELLANFVSQEIRRIGRKAAMLSRMRGCDSSNFVDMVSALESTNQNLYNMIFKEKVVSEAKQLPKQVVALSHTSLIQPAVLSQPSALYFECMVNASSHLSEINNNSENAEATNTSESDVVYNSMSKPTQQGLTSVKGDSVIDLDYFLTSATRDTYSLKSDEAYQKIVASRPPFAHKHFPLLPPAFKMNDSNKNEMTYHIDAQGNTNERLARQNILLQMELPLLHRVQVRPDLQEMRDEAQAAKAKEVAPKSV
ncbi:transcription initiation factor TFIID complex subunit TAF8, putative [Babesia ovis]|uniref:Transcription initiation factor TFIID complex subunit TAF8, putative n=1 Tax=Babesia ovis TaxID=5869 RepID=A0A9W5T9Z6_BABOV|nr:transcription initiation factor TFIID complex subunit TAF8, putative [Babesia ovis]